LDFGRFAVTGSRRTELLLPSAQLLFGALEPAVTDGEVQFCFARAVEPPQAIAFGGHFRHVVDRELVKDLALVIGLDQFSVYNMPEVTPEGYRLWWFHSTRKAEL